LKRKNLLFYKEVFVENETKNIAIACFIGGVICSATALLFAPAYWWLGMLAGFAGGYISYEFREVREAIPVAIENARYNLSDGWKMAGLLFTELKKFALQPHPFALCWLIINTGFWGFLYAIGKWHGDSTDVAGVIILFSVTGFFVALPLTGLLAVIPAQAGYNADGWGGQWVTNPALASSRRPLLTYKNAFRWIGKGYVDAAIFFLWEIWKYIAIGIWFLLRFTAKFLWELFKLIHSEKRLLCAVDGTLGGLVSYFWLASSTTTTGGHIVLVLFGGLLGAGLGILNWEIVSKRVLKVGNQEA